MKKLTGLVAVLAVVLLGSYYAMGYMTERTVKKTFVNLNKMEGVSLTVDEYDRGWFKSQAMVKSEVHVPERVEKDSNGGFKTIKAQDYNFEMPMTIYHGPIIISDGGVKFGLGYGHVDIDMPKKVSMQMNKLFTYKPDAPSLDISIFVNYLNRSNIELSVPPFEMLAKKGNGTINWKGMKSTTYLSSNLDKVIGNFVIDGFDISKDKINVVLDNFNTDYDLYESSRGLMLGKANMTLPSFIVTENKQKLFEIDDFSINSQNQVNDGLFEATMTASLAKVIAQGQTFGPGKLVMSIKNLDADTLAVINKQVVQSQNGSKAQKQQMLLSLLPQLPKLLGQGAEFEISTLNFVMPQGNIDGNFKISLPKDSGTNPFEVAQKIKGQGKLTISEDVLKMMLKESARQKLVKQPSLQHALANQMQGDNSVSSDNQVDINKMVEIQAQQDLSRLSQSGVLLKKGNTYVVEFNLENGQFTINGKPYSPKMLKSS